MFTEKSELYTFIITGSVLLAVLALFLIIFVIAYKRRQHQNKKERIYQELLFQEQLLHSKIEIQEQAFSDISRELHDNIGQQLSLARLHLHSIKDAISEQDSKKIETANGLMGDVLYQIRTISKTLLGERVNAVGIKEAIGNEVARISNLGICDIQFETEEEIFTIQPQKEIILFRIVQEAINNALKHAEGCNIVVTLLHKNVGIFISVKDFGKGFQSNALAGGVGLMNMKNRAKTIGAELFINSAPDSGTTIEIFFKEP